MLRIPYFARYSSAESLSQRLRSEFPYIDALEKVANRRRIIIREPFQGETIGAFKVLAPSPGRYLQLVINSDKTPQHAQGIGILSGLFADMAKPIVRFIKSGWGSERFSTEDTSTENEMSVVQYAAFSGRSVVLTGDAGRAAMTEAADYAPQAGLHLPRVTDFQAPHHGGRRNVNSQILVWGAVKSRRYEAMWVISLFDGERHLLVPTWRQLAAWAERGSRVAAGHREAT